jgi:predicted nuclease of predicted toxin-antitoxin system
MQVVADENVSHRVVERLRADGHDVMLVAEMRSGMSDTDVLKLADTETCILVTEDQDFGELIFRQNLSVQGIVLLELDRLSTEAEADRVAQVSS